MIYSLKGKIAAKSEKFFVIETGGVGFKVVSSRTDLEKIPAVGAEAKIFCFLYFREDQIELYGFLEEPAEKLFEMLNTVSGVGPRTALAVLDLDAPENIMAAIMERKTDLLTRAPGIGQKTAERVILELQSKIRLPKSGALTRVMDLNAEVEEALVSLGYLRRDVKNILQSMGSEPDTVEERLRTALKSISKNRIHG